VECLKLTEVSCGVGCDDDDDDADETTTTTTTTA
jgi:hypothetical protein